MLGRGAPPFSPSPPTPSLPLPSLRRPGSSQHPCSGHRIGGHQPLDVPMAGCSPRWGDPRVGRACPGHRIGGHQPLDVPMAGCSPRWGDPRVGRACAGITPLHREAGGTTGDPSWGCRRGAGRVSVPGEEMSPCPWGWEPEGLEETLPNKPGCAGTN